MVRRGQSGLPRPLALAGVGAAATVGIAATLLGGCATGRGSSRPNDGLAEALCSAAPGDETRALARALLEGMKPEVELAIQPLEPASPTVTAAWTYEAYMHTQRASVHASAVRLGVAVDGERRPDVPLDPRVIAPLIGEAVPAGHWDWVEVPPTCRLGARLPLEGEGSLQAWLGDHHTPRRVDLGASTGLRVRELGTTADLQLDSGADVSAYLRGDAGVSCACGPLECRCHRAGPAALRSDGLGPFQWKNPLCCAGDDWPTQGTCTCSPVGCSRSEQGGVRRCVCNAHGGIQDSAWTPVPQCDPIAPERCCADAFGCSCATHRSACAEGEVEVQACRPETFTCGEAPAHQSELHGTRGLGVTVSTCAPG